MLYRARIGHALIITIVALSGGKWFKEGDVLESYFDESVQGPRGRIADQVSRRTGRNGDAITGFVGDIYGEELGKKTCCAMGAIFLSVDLLLIWHPISRRKKKETERGGRITAGLRVRLGLQA